MSEEIQNMIDRANAGDVKAMEILGDCYLYGEEVKKDDVMAHKYYMMAADRGSIPAKYMVGMDYLTGEGVQKNISCAETYIRAAADAGMAKAQYILGLMYQHEDIGFWATDKKAFQCFEKAAKQGHGKAQVKLSDAYMVGAGVKADLSKGLFWLACAYLHGKNDADVGNAAVERMNSLIHNDVPGGRERIEDMISYVKSNYSQYTKEPV